MDCERKIHISEGVPLNSTGAANIFLNTSNNKNKDPKINTHDGTVIHLKTEKPSDLGLHINTTFSIASSKKMKLLFIFNFLLSIICMVLSCSVAFYYWNEMISMRRQLDLIKDNFLIQNFGQDKMVSSALVAPRPGSMEPRESRMMNDPKDEGTLNARKYFVENLGEDMLLVDSKKKNSTKDNTPVYDLSILHKELLIAQFNGGMREINLGNEGVVGPWVRDAQVSSKNSAEKIELHTDYFVIKESGLYLVYAQIVYLTQSPNCFFLWAHLPEKEPRLLTTCATGDDSTKRPLNKSQISCSVQTIARLYEGDILNMSQREPNRTLWLRPGYSYIGFVKLSS